MWIDARNSAHSTYGECGAAHKFYAHHIYHHNSQFMYNPVVDVVAAMLVSFSTSHCPLLASPYLSRTRMTKATKVKKSAIDADGNASADANEPNRPC